jgi:hypothetical protein
MRESRTYGSVRGVRRETHSYRDSNAGIVQFRDFLSFLCSRPFDTTTGVNIEEELARR